MVKGRVRTYVGPCAGGISPAPTRPRPGRSVRGTPMPNGRSCGLALWLMTAMWLGSDASAASPVRVEKGERYYLSTPVSYWIYQVDAKKCGLPLDKVKCQGDKELTICAYSQGACEWA